ncbi:LysM peptidoglycan-binding domain-containing protein [Lysobacter enzymogenes]|uniref:LysM peptidoglycan-binding domain-containing protein n=1 Tax=Lysobacter enzymogenes TaxID=69 RepID=UPI00099CFAE3|nr:LysM domain-containing protein [Lysobacter enzymogenes]UZW60905.1 LysM peptidoglycan-binding domain-containing protein [Lysobacter enzymogenes]
MSLFSFIDSVARTVQQLATQPKPLPPVHTIARDETLPQIAAQYRGSVPQETFEQQIKDANPQVLNWDALYPDTEIALPPAEHDGAQAQTVAYTQQAPAKTDKSPEVQRVDTAVQADAAHSTPETRAELKAAVKAEMQSRYQAEFDARPTGAVYDAKTIDGYGRSIAERYADDPAARAGIEAVSKDIRVDHEVEFTVMVANAGDPKSVVAILKDQWSKISPEAQQRLSTSIELGKLINEKIEPYVAEPFKGVDSGGDPKALMAPANEASRRLAELTDGLPPALAQAVVTQNLDTVLRITEVKPMYAGGNKFGEATSYANMARVYESLGDTGDGPRLRSDLAASYVGHSGDWRGQGYPFSENISNAIRDGVGPGLALEMARQLQGKGENELAGVFLRGVSHGAELLQQRIEGNLGQYKEMMGELARLLKYSEGLPPDKLNKAVNDYLAAKGKDDPDWLSKYQKLEKDLAADGRLLQETLGGLNALPAQVKATNPELMDTIKSIANDDDTLQAFGLAAGSDDRFLVGENADSTAALFDATKVSKEGAEYLKRLASQAINQNAMNVFAGVDPDNPASVADGKTRLEAMSRQYSGALGADAEQYRRAIGELEKLLDVPAGDTQAMATQLNKFHTELQGIEGFGAKQPAGITFRALGVAAAGLAFGKSTADAISDPTWANQIAAFGDAAGLVKDARDLLTNPAAQAVDRNSPAAMEALESGLKRFENVNKVLGVVSAVGDVAKLVDALLSDRPLKGVEAGLYGLGATGTVIMAVSTGPVGALVGSVMIGVSVFGQSALGDYRDKQGKVEGSMKFLQNAGFDADAAAVLSDQGEDEYYLSIPTVPLIMQAARDDRIGAGRPLEGQAAIDYINEMPRDKLQVMVNQLRMANR